MKNKRIIRNILIGLVALVLIIAGIGFSIINNLLYPNALITGNGNKKVVVVGDSITYGQGVLSSRETESYPAILAGLLGEEYQTVNYGLCNRTLLSSGNMPYIKEDFAKTSLTEDAEIVIIMLGTNDSKPANWNATQYEQEYIQFVQTYQNMDSNPDVYIMLPPRVFREPENDGDCNNTILTTEVIPAIEHVASQTGVKLIDLYTITEEHSDWYSDGLHPNAKGNNAIAQTIYAAITSEQ